MMKNIGTVFKTIDAYPKTLEDFTIKTATGALGNDDNKSLNISLVILTRFMILPMIVVTIVSSLTMVILFALEFQDFSAVHVLEQLYVDTSRIPNMRINFDVTFPRLGCECKDK